MFLSLLSIYLYSTAATVTKCSNNEINLTTSEAKINLTTRAAFQWRNEEFKKEMYSFRIAKALDKENYFQKS